jgi:hypothetical protein
MTVVRPWEYNQMCEPDFASNDSRVNPLQTGFGRVRSGACLRDIRGPPQVDLKNKVKPKNSACEGLQTGERQVTPK